jgi:predicted PurR-regulated permease PerM
MKMISPHSQHHRDEPAVNDAKNAVPNNSKPEVKPRSISFYVLLGAASLVFIETFSLLSPILLSLILILLISLAVNPLISRMRALTGGRKVATALVAAAFLLVIGVTGWVFIGPLKTATVKIAAKIPSYLERLQSPLLKPPPAAQPQTNATTGIQPTAAAASGQVTMRAAPEPAPPKTAPEPGSLLSGLSQMLQGVASGFKSMALNASQIMVVCITVFFGVTFTLMNPRPIFRAIFSIVPEGHHQQTLIILQRIGKFLPSWAFGTLLAMLIVGSLVFLLMWPFFGFQDALVLGLIAGVFEAVPYLGPLLSAVPALFFALSKGGMTPVWVLLLYLAVQLLENNAITPLIMARSMKLHPLAVMFSMLLCIEIFGMLGVLVAAPMVAIVEILHDELYRKRFLPTVTDADLQLLARNALRERQSAGN